MVRPFLRSICGGALTFVLAGCADPKPGLYAFDPSVLFTRRGIGAMCAGAVVHHSEEVVFPDPGVTCAYGSGGNLSRRDGFVRARAEQAHALDIPNDSLICQASISSPSQRFSFDDEIFLTFNDVVLMMSQPAYAHALPVVSGLMRFDWETMKNQSNAHSDGHPFCFGASDGSGSCSIPATQRNGAIHMDWNQQAMAGLSEKIQSEPLRELRLITTGDNDNTDCRHSELRLTIDLTYVRP